MCSGLEKPLEPSRKRLGQHVERLGRPSKEWLQRSRKRMQRLGKRTARSQNASCNLLTEAGQAINGEQWNWGSNLQIGWAFAKIGSGTSQLSDDRFNMIDPENLVVEDLFIQGFSSDGTGQKINYLIEMEKYDFSESLGVLAMVRNRAQS